MGLKMLKTLRQLPHNETVLNFLSAISLLNTFLVLEENTVM